MPRGSWLSEPAFVVDDDVWLAFTWQGPYGIGPGRSSVGRWEGDTLVVTTGHLRDGEWLDFVGMPSTDAATYTGPWTVRVNQRIMSELELLEFVCNENNRYFVRD